MTIQEACQRIGKSESTIRRWLKTSKLTAKLIDGVYDIPENAINSLVNDYPNDKASEQQPEGNEQVIIKRLEAENEYLKERIQELEDARERADTISLQLTRQLEQSQRMLEAHKEPFWRRWFRKEQN